MMETPPPSLSATHEETSDKQPVDTEQLLSLLGDEYTRAIFDALGTESLPAREIATRADVSRPTVYRRLEQLESAGVVEPTMRVDPDGHHRQAFQLTIDGFELSLGDQPDTPAESPDGTGSSGSPITLSVHADSP
jgi:Sugar-specific transcriptional regulator TrmB.